MGGSQAWPHRHGSAIATLSSRLTRARRQSLRNRVSRDLARLPAGIPGQAYCPRAVLEPAARLRSTILSALWPWLCGLKRKGPSFSASASGPAPDRIRRLSRPSGDLDDSWRVLDAFLGKFAQPTTTVGSNASPNRSAKPSNRLSTAARSARASWRAGAGISPSRRSERTASRDARRTADW
jgi:hypothetical protein